MPPATVAPGTYGIRKKMWLEHMPTNSAAGAARPYARPNLCATIHELCFDANPNNLCAVVMQRRMHAAQMA